MKIITKLKKSQYHKTSKKHKNTYKNTKNNNEIHDF